MMDVKTLKPYLSIVVAVRNDNHGGDFIQRFNLFLNSLFHLGKIRSFPFEIIIVEWNTPDYKPSIIKNIDIDNKPSCCDVRLIQVSPKIHKKYKYSDKLPIYQMIAKNVGIKRAKGDFILCTNADIIFSEELFVFLSEMELDENKLYRVVRYDVKFTNKYNKFDDLIRFCKNNIIRINHKITYHPEQNIDFDLLENIERFNYLEGKSESPAKSLFINACGDFQLMSKKAWNELRGYPEFDRFSFHIDSIFEYQAVNSGYEELILPDDLRIYHIEHTSGYTPESEKNGKFDKQFPDGFKITYDELISIVKKIELNTSKIKYFNTENWGLALEEINEFDFNRKFPKVTFVAVPKPFENKFTIIQKNAIQSWLNLSLNVEILILCEKGFKCPVISDKIRLIDELENTKFNRPDLSSAMRLADKYASNDCIVYINSDIILLDDFSKTIETVLDNLNDNYGIIGQRIDVNIEEEIDFSNIHWQDNVFNYVKEGILHSKEGIDYFVFPKKFLKTLNVPLSIGGTVWDQWIVYKMLNRGYLVIDATNEIIAVHQNHSYPGNMSFTEILNSDMARTNMQLAGGRACMRNISDCNAVIQNGKILNSNKKNMNLEKVKSLLGLTRQEYLQKTDYVLSENTVLESVLTTLFNDYYGKNDLENALRISLFLDNNPDMLFNCAVILLEKDSDYSIIVSCLEKVHAFGYLKGYNLLGLKYSNNVTGKHVEYWKSNKNGKLPSEIVLGLIYFFGLGCPKDTVKGIKYIKKQILENKKYFKLFYKLFITMKDKTTRLEIIKELKNNPDPDIQYFIGYVYANGKGVEQNDNIANRHFEKAAENGISYGYNYLGVKKIFGINSDIDLIQAYDFFYKGASIDNKICIKNLELLKNYLAEKNDLD